MEKKNDRRSIIEAAKCLIILGGKDELVSAKLALEFGGKAADYRGHVRQAHRELEYAKIAENAIREHVQLGGEVHRNAKKFAGMVQLGPAKPECPYPAIVTECKKLIDEWSSENLYGTEWRKRVNFAKDAIEDGEEAEKLLAVRWPGDNPFLQQKIMAVARRELSKDAETTLAAVINPGNKKSGQGKKNKKAAKAARRQLDADRIKRIFGQRAA